MSDRLAVMNGGHIEQVGAPQDVYEDPETLFVADFLGVSNLMEARTSALSSCRLSTPLSTRGTERRHRRSEDRHPPRAHRASRSMAPSGPNRILQDGRARRLRRFRDPGHRAATGESFRLCRTPAQEFPTSRGPAAAPSPGRRAASAALRIGDAPSLKGEEPDPNRPPPAEP